MGLESNKGTSDATAGTMENVNYGYEDDEKGESPEAIEMKDASAVVTTPKKANTFKERRGFCARCFFSPVTFTIILVIWTILKASSQGYASSTITTIEKRFRLRSTHIGLFAIVEDVVGLTTVMFITHFGQKSHRPRFIGLLSLIVAAGIFLQGLPHFLYSLPEDLLTKSSYSNATDEGEMVCLIGGEDFSQNCTDEEEAAAGALIREAFWLPLGSAVISLGSALGPISITYLDDNVSRSSMPIYAGIVFSVFVFGSIFGFFLASFTLSLPITFLSNNPDFDAKPDDANFLGAWWLGYFISSFLLAVFGLLFCLFPRQLRDPEELARQNEEYLKNNPLPESAKSAKPDFESYSGLIEFLKDFLVSLKAIVTNVVVMCLTLSGCLVAFTSTVFLIFGPKFLSVVFELPPGLAALAFGAFLIPGAFLGQILGGVFIKSAKLTRYGLAFVAVATDTFLVFALVFFYLIRCDKRAIAGLTVPYNGQTLMDNNITAPCNMDCGCPVGDFDPVCGEDGITYVTACHAGCSVEINEGNETYFDNCACILDAETGLMGGNATANQCEVPCKNFLYFIIIMIPSSFLGTFGGIAGFMLQLRSVDDAHRGLALSFSNVLIRILGYIPGPVIIGFVIERSCVLYQRMCGITGNCDVYDSHRFLVGFVTSLAVASMLSSAFIVIVFLYVRHTTPKDKRHFTIKDAPDEGQTKA